jgi:phage gpG-like protein
VHQFGTTKAGRAKNTTIPERPFMPIDEDGNVYEEVKEELLELLEEYLSEF